MDEFSYEEWESQYVDSLEHGIKQIENLIELTNAMMLKHFEDYAFYRKQCYLHFRECKESDDEWVQKTAPKPNRFRVVIRSRPLTTAKFSQAYSPPKIAFLTLARQVGKFTEHVPADKEGDYSVSRTLRNVQLKVGAHEREYISQVVHKTNELNKNMRTLTGKYMALIEMHYRHDAFVMIKPELQHKPAHL